MNKHSHSHDGTQNREHISDIIEKCEMLFANIQDNTDLAARLFSFVEEKVNDKDILDAVRLDCEDIIQIEKLADNYISQISNYKNKIIKDDEHGDIFDIYSELKDLENKSTKLVEQVLKTK